MRKHCGVFFILGTFDAVILLLGPAPPLPRPTPFQTARPIDAQSGI
jgi:hypothetical protein